MASIAFPTPTLIPQLAVLEVIHISDSHLGPDASHTIRGANAYDRACALVQAINQLPFQPDFIVHTGDVVNDPDHDAYRLAESVFSQLKAPVYYVTGNHDDVAMMRQHLSHPHHRPLLPDQDQYLCYQLEGGQADQVEFFVMDGHLPPSDGPHGHLNENQMEAVLEAISGTKPVAVFLHYPLIPVGSPWIDQHLLLDNGEAWQRRLSERCGHQLRGIFTGHLHRDLHLFQEGVFHSGVSSPACEFSIGPLDNFCDFIPGNPIPFHHITFTADSTMVKQHALPFAGDSCVSQTPISASS